MKLTNETHYLSADLRAFFLAGLRKMEACSKGKTVIVTYTRPTKWRVEKDCNVGYVSGLAYFGHWRRRAPDTDGTPRREYIEGRVIVMRLPRDPTLLSLALFARVFEHEVLHTQGVKHRSMGPAVRYPNGSPDAPVPAWAAGLEVRVEEAPAPAPLEERRDELVAKREAHARAKLAEYEVKAKRVAKLAAKWRQKVRGYERRAAARAAEKA